MTEPLSIDVYWSFRSPWSYLATPRLADWQEKEHHAGARERREPGERREPRVREGRARRARRHAQDVNVQFLAAQQFALHARGQGQR